jgi:hypothetical protein
MVLLVHLTPDTHLRRILRAGIKATSQAPDGTRGVYCLPILPSYVISHQWLRELKRGGQRTIAAVDFRIPDPTPVLVGHYAQPARQLTAAQAAGLIAAQPDPRGYQLLVPRPITRRELHRVRRLPQALGWRYQPDAHGRPPCPCPVCLPPGSFKAGRLRRRLDPDPPPPTKPQLMAELATATDPDRIQELLWSLGTRRRGDAGALGLLLAHPSAEVRATLAVTLGAYRDRAATDLLARLCADRDPDVRQAAAESLLDRHGAAALPTLRNPGDDPVITAAVQQWHQTISGGDQPEPHDEGAA